MGTTKKTAQLRHEVTSLKRQVAQLERQVALLSRKALSAVPKVDSDRKPTRFSAKGLQAHRSRLRFGAGDFGKLLGVSAQSIYNGQREKARPRAEQIAKLIALRSVALQPLLGRMGSHPLAVRYMPASAFVMRVPIVISSLPGAGR